VNGHRYFGSEGMKVGDESAVGQVNGQRVIKDEESPAHIRSATPQSIIKIIKLK